MGVVKQNRRLSGLWAFLYRSGLVRARMPFWRVVVEARLDRRARRWPDRFEAAVGAVFVWARTIEEAEGLAALAVEREGMEAMTADAVKHPPAAPPRRQPAAVARTAWGFLPRIGSETDAQGAPQRGAPT